MDGWCSPEKAVRLAELVCETATGKSVELGIFGGRATIAMGMAHDQIKKGHCWGVDPWSQQASSEGENDPANDKWWKEVDYKGVHHRFVSTVLSLDLWDRVRWHHGTSDEASRLLVNFHSEDSVNREKWLFGIMHQDSNHSELVSCREIDIWAPYLEKGGYWILDDADWKSTQKALRMLAEQFEMVEDHGSWVVFRKE